MFLFYAMINCNQLQLRTQRGGQTNIFIDGLKMMRFFFTHVKLVFSLE